MILLNLIQNIALLVALAAVYQVVVVPLKQDRMLNRILLGFLFGGAGLVGMMTPLQFMPGIIFDGRSIILSVAGLFGGPVVAVVSAAMCGAYRLWLGGAGMWVGVGVIVWAAAIGAFFYTLRRRSSRPLRPLALWVFGLLVHLGMMVLMWSLPRDAAMEVMRRLSLSVLTVYPLATMLICLLFQNYDRQLRERVVLRESEERYRSLFTSNIDAVLLTVPDGGILAVNEAACRMLGRSAEEIMRLGRNGIMDTSDPRLPAALEERDRTGRFHGELTMIRGDGTKFPVEISTAVFLDQEGKSRTSMVIRDITERERAQQALKGSEERHRAFVNASVDMAFMKDATFHYVMVNEANRAFFDKPESDILGKTDFELMPREAALTCRETDAQALRENRVVVSTEVLGGRAYETRKFPVSLGSEMGIGGFIRDVTEIKRATERTRQQLDELQRWQEVTVEREERVAQLKREVNELAKRLGEKERYGG